jgi:hypothetical protein
MLGGGWGAGGARKLGMRLAPRTRLARFWVAKAVLLATVLGKRQTLLAALGTLTPHRHKLHRLAGESTVPPMMVTGVTN